MIEWLLSPFVGNGGGSHRREGGSHAGAARVPFGTASVPAFRDAVPDIAAELDRARRYEHPLALLVLTMHRPGDPPRSETRVPHVVALLAASILGEVLRESDVASYDAVAERYVLALVETDQEAAHQAIERLDRLIRGRLRMRIRAGLAVFPTEGLTLRQLLESANAGWKDDPVPLVSQRDDVGEATPEKERTDEPTDGVLQTDRQER